MRQNLTTRVWILAATILAGAMPIGVSAWGGLGHRLVADIAASRLTPVAAQNVAWLLDGRSMADISSWADQYLEGVYQTSFWHYLDIPPEASTYDRDRDCPRQPGVQAGGRGDNWRDCVVDRIRYSRERLADVTLDRLDRGIALKFLVHFVGDLHQPFHALGVGRGGNDVRVTVFGVSNCSNNPEFPRPCNLHSVWDSLLIGHRGWDERQSLAALEELIAARGWKALDPGTPEEWAVQSFQLSKAALVPDEGTIDETYYRTQIPVVDERLALAGVRLAALLNESLTSPPPGATTTLMRAKGEFDVKLAPRSADNAAEGAPLGRMSIDKVFRGDLIGTSTGEMLTAMSSATKDSGVYVAVERVTGTLNGRKGTFALHHTGIMDRGKQNLTITVVPDSGTGELAGITGALKIVIEGTKHFYELEYQLGR